MPKMIENLEKTIFRKAEDLFSYGGYDNVDMKAIAKEADIAVGTLYNYYGSKKDLFIKVFTSSWESTFLKLKEVVNEKDANKKIVTILYYDIKERRGLGSNLLNDKLFSKDENNNITNKIINKIIDILVFDKSFENEKIKKKVSILVYNIVLLNDLYPDNDEDNISFLYEIINSNIV